MIDAMDATGVTGTGAGFGFGLDTRNAAAMLRRLADEIEAGALALQKVDTHVSAAIESFCLTTLTVEYADRAEDAKRRAVIAYAGEDAATALYGTRHYPIDMAPKEAR